MSKVVIGMDFSRDIWHVYVQTRASKTWDLISIPHAGVG